MKSLLTSEPVRVYTYTVAVAVLALLVSFGLVKSDEVQVILGVLGAVLVVGGGEAVRANVSPSLEKQATAAVDAKSTTAEDPTGTPTA